MEDQELLECPYDKSHRILKHRMQIHLRKCGRNHVHPKEDLVTCPFNVTHVVPKVELEYHVLFCVERKTFENFKSRESPSSSKGTEPPPLPGCPSEENWDDEDAPTYNPAEYISSAPVLRNIAGASRSERKMFREKERLRLLGLKE